MTHRTATYHKTEGGRDVYYRASIPFPNGVAVMLDPAKIGPSAMKLIEEDPRLKVSGTSPEAVEVAAAQTAAPTTREGTNPEAVRQATAPADPARELAVAAAATGTTPVVEMEVQEVDAAEARAARIQAAIAGLGPDGLRQDGGPRVAAVRDALEEADHEFVTAEVVDAVWKGMREPA